MKTTVLSKKIVERAEDFHGHLGPFLIIGIRMGLTGLRRLGLRQQHRCQLSMTASLPLRTPFSCIIDGLQVTTRCTVGNQKLTLKKSEKIQTEFERKDNGQKILVTLNETTFETLKSQLLQETLPDEEVRALAWKIAEIDEAQLFEVVNL